MAPLDRVHAALYDRITASMEQRWLAAARQELVGRLSGQVLEIGVGTGANFSYYLPGARVMAIEPSAHFLKRARMKLAQAKASIDLRQADAQALPFADDTFDAAVATLVFCTVPDPLAALTEIRRVLRDGAPLLLIEHVRARTPGWRLLLNLWNPCQRVLAGGCNLNRDTEATVRAAGFQVEEVRDLALVMGVPFLVVRATNRKAGAAP